MAAVLELIAGSYEQVTFGYRVRTDEKEWTAKADFTHHAHTASISALAASERFVVTGSKDETIRVYDMKKKTEHGALLHHDGTITCLEFYGTSHLLSGGEDGLICVWSTKKWECLKSIKAHKGHVTSLSVHPSGKLVLSVGTDKTLRTWNLINGRSAFIKNIKQNAHIVRWSPDGAKYVVVVNDRVNIYDLETASVTATITNPKRISCVKFLNNSILAVAGDDEIVRLCDTGKEKWLCEFKAHETRVKSVESFNMEDYCVIVTASNDGFIKMWKLHLKEARTFEKLLKQYIVNHLQLDKDKASSFIYFFCARVTPTICVLLSVEITQELLKKKRVKIATEEVVLEDESKPKKKKKGSGKTE
ncbi:p21-activated protein kinase-interacting protein 1-like PAK1-interacting protein 1-like [Channa argus]|uniref:p21-activated protein kinase-interacting protein 1-like PAK1-interacting protein 1-like n=1 Tax=Channa argus TaxID=215402 RepID=A0A6G1Q854_CHAAH|nr:p21-activated protein kinase-interacting protein 1-like PAK1-interacting protein 1-like [Channa argus]